EAIAIRPPAQIGARPDCSLGRLTKEALPEGKESAQKAAQSLLVDRQQHALGSAPGLAVIGIAKHGRLHHVVGIGCGWMIFLRYILVARRERFGRNVFRAEPAT